MSRLIFSALYNLPSINSNCYEESNDDINISTSNLFETLEYIFRTVVHLFYFHSNHTTNTSIAEINNTHIQIAQALINLSLPQLSIECKTIWFYQKKTRSILLIFRQLFSLQPSTFTTTFPSNPIGSIITIIYNYLSSATLPPQYLFQLAFDVLQGFALFIENTFSDTTQSNPNQRRTTNDLLNLINQFLTSDYFSLFILLNSYEENESRAKELLEHCSIILKRAKIFRSEELQRKQNRRFIKTYWQNTYEQAYILHHHQNSLEITMNNRNVLDGNIEIRNENDENNQIRRICVISAIYDKLLRLAIKQLELNQPSFSFIQVSYLSQHSFDLSLILQLYD